MFSTQPFTIEILASGKPPAEISLHTNTTDVAFTVLPDKTETLNNQRYRPPNTLFKYDNTLQNNAKNLLLSDKNQNKIQKTTPQADLDFLFKLDAKLQRFKDMARRHRKKDNTETLHKQPFMTVVRQGTFLKPPPGIAALLGLPSGQGPGAVTTPSDVSLSTSHPGAKRPLLLYSFSSRPRVLHHTCSAKQQNVVDPEKEERKLYFGNRDRSAPVATVEPVRQNKEELPTYPNYMYDRRSDKVGVVSYAQPKLTEFSQGGLSTAGPNDIRRTDNRRQTIAKRRSHGYRSLPGRGSSTTPPPLPGRQHLVVQTEQFLEELVARPPETDAASQTDEFADVPLSPPYVAAVLSSDASTQTEQGEPIEIEADVEPILDSLVGSTVVTALVEVLEEEEIATNLRLHEALCERRRLQEEQHRRIEYEKRLIEERDRVFQDAQLSLGDRDLSKRTAALFAKVHVSQVLPGVLQSLPCSLADDITERSIPTVIEEVQEELQKLLSNKEIIADIVREVVHTRAEIRRAMGDPSFSRSETVSSTGSGGGIGERLSAQLQNGGSQQPPHL